MVLAIKMKNAARKGRHLHLRAHEFVQPVDTLCACPPDVGTCNTLLILKSPNIGGYFNAFNTAVMMPASQWKTDTKVPLDSWIVTSARSMSECGCQP